MITKRAGSEIRYDVSGIRDLKRAVEGLKRWECRVGVLGQKTMRHDDDNPGVSNADIGLAHEYGSKTRNLPARSWLRMPLIQFLSAHMQKLGNGYWRIVFDKKGARAALRALGTIAVNIIQLAFESGGFGQWRPLKPATIARKRSGKRNIPGSGYNPSSILIDSAQLRQSVSSAVVRR